MNRELNEAMHKILNLSISDGKPDLWKVTCDADLSKQAKGDLKMGNQKTQKKYTGYVQDLHGFIENEGEKGLTTNRTTMHQPSGPCIVRFTHSIRIGQDES